MGHTWTTLSLIDIGVAGFWGTTSGNEVEGKHVVSLGEGSRVRSVVENVSGRCMPRDGRGDGG
jgi:hypothetical protein